MATYFNGPGGINVDITIILADKVYVIRIEIKLKRRIFVNTCTIIRQRNSDIEDIRKNDESKKKCNKIPIDSHAGNFGIFLPLNDANIM